jgi:hypothetical protein
MKVSKEVPKILKFDVLNRTHHFEDVFWVKSLTLGRAYQNCTNWGVSSNSGFKGKKNKIFSLSKSSIISLNGWLRFKVHGKTLD